MTLPRWLSLFLAWTLLLQSLTPALATPLSPATEHSNRIGMDRQTLGTVGMGYGVTGVEHHQYLVDTSQPYAEVIQEAEWVNNALPLITRYDIGLDRLRMFKSQVTSNGPPPVYAPGMSAWYLFDGLGSTRALVDDGGVGTDLWGYQDAFGIPYRLYPTTGGTVNTFFLNGQQWDGSGIWNSGEGLYFNRARYYQPGLGRFIGEDPLLGRDYSPTTLHRYIYTGNDCVNYVDKDGKQFLSMVMATLAIFNITGSRVQYDSAAIGARTYITQKLVGDTAVSGISAVSATGTSSAVATSATVSTGYNLFGSVTINWTIGITAALLSTITVGTLPPIVDGPGDNNGRRRRVPVYEFRLFSGIPKYNSNPASVFPDTAQHIYDSITGTGMESLSKDAADLDIRMSPKPALLYYDRPSEETKDARRDASLGGLPGIRRNRIPILGQGTFASYDLDEYPFASTVQGGSGANVRVIETRDNQAQGQDINQFYRKILRNYTPSWFFVLPIPE